MFVCSYSSLLSRRIIYLWKYGLQRDKRKPIYNRCITDWLRTLLFWFFSIKLDFIYLAVNIIMRTFYKEIYTLFESHFIEALRKKGQLAANRILLYKLWPIMKRCKNLVHVSKQVSKYKGYFLSIAYTVPQGTLFSHCSANSMK